MQATAHVSTDHAAGYMQRLCRHFAHKVPAEVNGDTAHVQFNMGTCDMRADAARLSFHIAAADAAALDTVKDIVGDHFERFAFRDGLKVVWSDAE